MSTKRRVSKRSSKAPSAFNRYMLIVAVFSIWVLGISVRLVHLQVSQTGQLSELADRQRRQVEKTKAPRGSIFDRDGNVLAMNVRVQTLAADPTMIKNVEKTARDIAKAAKVDQQGILEKIRTGKANGKRFVRLVQKLDEGFVKQINAALDDESVKKADAPRYEGLMWVEDQKRSYPNKTLAAHIVGFSNANDEGQAGIEKSQDTNLQGAEISRVTIRDNKQRVYEETEPAREPAKDVVLTLSSTVQFKTEVALEKGVKAANAKSGMAVAMNPKTGEILSIANYPTFDPNEYGKYAPELWKNNAVQNFYTPGSVFKLVTYGAALEKEQIAPNEHIDCSAGAVTVAGHTFKDSHTIGSVKYSEAMAQSSNVAAIKTGLGVGREGFYNFAKKMGFGEQTGVELPGEVSGILRSPKAWNGDSLASMSIGYELSVSALQLASSFATIANEGIRVQPHIIKKIRNANGEEIFATEPATRKVVEPKTASALREMLRQVVLTGTAKRAQLNGYSSAGKTGTAWKFDETYGTINPNKFFSTFAGYAPAEDPQIVIVVMLDEPRGGMRDGGQVSAPIFCEIAERVLTEMGVAANPNYKRWNGVIAPESSANSNSKPEKDGSAHRSEDRKGKNSGKKGKT